MTKHISVLLNACMEQLQIKADGIYVDGTLGRGGHSSEILKRIPQGHLYAIDRDQSAIIESEERLAAIGSNFTLIHATFAQVKEVLAENGVTQIDGMLLDLGVSSPQFDEAKRGFSYRFDAPLDMRMDQSQSFCAYDVVNTYPYEELVRIFYRYGEEPFAKVIAKRIEKQREQKAIETTFELVEVIKSALPTKVLNKKGHPAKRIFQAIRIEVNDELKQLEEGLHAALSLLAPGGRLAVITFHSLEDRIVKETFKRYGAADKVDKRIPLLPAQIEAKPYRLVTRKPIIPDLQEQEANNRAHSAKLRVIERIK